MRLQSAPGPEAARERRNRRICSRVFGPDAAAELTFGEAQFPGEAGDPGRAGPVQGLGHRDRHAIGAVLPQPVAQGRSEVRRRLPRVGGRGDLVLQAPGLRAPEEFQARLSVDHRRRGDLAEQRPRRARPQPHPADQLTGFERDPAMAGVGTGDLKTAAAPQQVEGAVRDHTGIRRRVRCPTDPQARRPRAERPARRTLLVHRRTDHPSNVAPGSDTQAATGIRRRSSTTVA
jgi:hypothetical protein